MKIYKQPREALHKLYSKLVVITMRLLIQKQEIQMELQQPALLPVKFILIMHLKLFPFSSGLTDLPQLACFTIWKFFFLQDLEHTEFSIIMDQQDSDMKLKKLNLSEKITETFTMTSMLKKLFKGTMDIFLCIILKMVASLGLQTQPFLCF